MWQERPRRTEGQNKSASVWQGFVSHSVVGKYTQTRQKRLRGQNRKTLVTAGTIKRPLPCPLEEVEKQRAYFTTLKEKQSKRKRKKIRTKTERKRKKTKKERGELVQRAYINRSASLSLSPFKILHFSKNANKDFPIETITIQSRLPQSH